MSTLFTTALEPFLHIVGQTSVLDEFYGYDYIGCKYMVVGISSSGTVEVNEFLVIHDFTSAQLSNIITTSNRSPTVMTFTTAFLRDHVRLTLTTTHSLKIRVYKTCIPTQ